MRKIITILVSTIALATFASTASAGDRHYRQRGGDGAIVGAIVGAFAGAIIGGAIASQPRHHNRVPYYDGNQRGWNDQRRSTQRLQGYGERAGAGQYCPYRLDYNPYTGRHHCVR